MAPVKPGNGDGRVQKIFFFFNPKKGEIQHTPFHTRWYVLLEKSVHLYGLSPHWEGGRGWGWRTVPSMKLTISETYQSHHNAASHTCEAF